MITRTLLTSQRFLSVYTQGELEFTTPIFQPLISCIQFQEKLYALDTAGNLWEITISELSTSPEILRRGVNLGKEGRPRSAQEAIQGIAQGTLRKDLLIAEIQKEQKTRRRSADPLTVPGSHDHHLIWDKLKGGKVIRRKSRDLVPDSLSSKRKSTEIGEKEEDIPLAQSRSLGNPNTFNDLHVNIDHVEKRKDKDKVVERVIGANEKIYQLTWRNCLQLPKDEYGGFPRWLTIQKEMLMAGGNGINNKSLYLLKPKKSKFQIQKINLTDGFTKLNKKLAEHDANYSPDKLYYYHNSVITLEATSYLVEDVFTKKKFLLTTEDERTICLKLEEFGLIRLISHKQNTIYGIFATQNGLQIGKLHSEKGLISRKLKTILFHGTGQRECDAFTFLS